MPNIKDLSQRELLIKLNVQFDDFKKYTADKLDRIEEDVSSVPDIRIKMAGMEERIKENTKLRNWVYGSLVTGIASALMALMALKK